MHFLQQALFSVQQMHVERGLQEGAFRGERESAPGAEKGIRIAN